MPTLVRSPRLPWDILLLIIKCCDTPTLAKLARVSFDFLASTSHLYHHIELGRLKPLVRLFWEFASTKVFATSRIAPYLSPLQIRTLTLNFSSVHFEPRLLTTHPLNLSFARIGGSDPLSIDKIRIEVNQNSLDLVIALQRELLPHLNPISVVYACRSIPLAYQYNQSPKLSELLHSWSRLRSISFDGVISSSAVTGLACIPPLTIASLEELVFCFPSAFWKFQHWRLRVEAAGVLGARDGSIRLVVASAASKVEFEEVIAHWGDESHLPPSTQPPIILTNFNPTPDLPIHLRPLSLHRPSDDVV
ncbi:hypothetical protein BDY24DRAFT_442070 [Mrakia frigida]|uniref:uncharacterized protein n=1 Tax=Mrakia frigida TaxID=29902 RepID=UPI003FCC19C8